jgi:2-dehydro-3-deoxyphosphooctonate aldolase (KDO 8-P synthase)
MVALGSLQIDNHQSLILIAGPCVIEREEISFAIADHLAALARELGIGVIFKASYDKANRSAASSFRGPGISAGLRMLARIKQRFHLPVLTDVHAAADAVSAARVCDVLQIPAFLCRQTDLIVAAAKTGKIINIKKGQFMAPEDMRHAVDKARSAGNRRVMVTERGYSFGYHNLVVDMRALEIMKDFRAPVIFDATHAVQLPGGLGNRSGGQRQFIEPLARAAAAVGIAGVFVETHPHPAKALSDGPNALPLKELKGFVKQLMAIDRVVKKVN